MQQSRSLLFFTLFLLASCSGNLKNGNTSDTTFLLKISNKDYSQKVYIEHNRNSEEYKSLLNFTFDSAANASFTENTKYLKQKHPEPLKRYDLAGLPKEWIPVFFIKASIICILRRKAELKVGG